MAGRVLTLCGRCSGGRFGRRRFSGLVGSTARCPRQYADGRHPRHAPAPGDIAAVAAAETGMSFNAAGTETDAAIAQGEFMAGEGRRLYGRTATSAVPNKWAMTVREPLGVAGLIIAANTPIANIAWKVFPALVCGNTAVLKAAEDAPATAWFFGKLAHAAGLPPGVLNIVQGFGPEAGAPLVEDPRVAVVSFTGSTAVGRVIARAAGSRLAQVSLELGGKNPLVVCDDADLDHAATGRCARPSATPASAVPPAAGSSSSTRSTTASGTCWWSAPGASRSAPGTTTTSGRSSTSANSTPCWRP